DRDRDAERPVRPSQETRVRVEEDRGCGSHGERAQGQWAKRTVSKIERRRDDRWTAERSLVAVRPWVLRAGRIGAQAATRRWVGPVVGGALLRELGPEDRLEERVDRDADEDEQDPDPDHRERVATQEVERSFHLCYSGVRPVGLLDPLGLRLGRERRGRDRSGFCHTYSLTPTGPVGPGTRRARPR